MGDVHYTKFGYDIWIRDPGIYLKVKPLSGYSPNLLPDPEFTSGLGGFYRNLGRWTVSSSALIGDYASTVISCYSPLMRATPGYTYRARTWVRDAGCATSARPFMNLIFRDSSGKALWIKQDKREVPMELTRFQAQDVAPAGTTWVQMELGGEPAPGLDGGFLFSKPYVGAVFAPVPIGQGAEFCVEQEFQYKAADGYRVCVATALKLTTGWQYSYRLVSLSKASNWTSMVVLTQPMTVNLGGLDMGRRIDIEKNLWVLTAAPPNSSSDYRVAYDADAEVYVNELPSPRLSWLQVNAEPVIYD